MDPKDRPLPSQPIHDEAEATTPPPTIVATTVDPEDQASQNTAGPYPLAPSHSSSSSSSGSQTPSVGKHASRTNSPLPAPPTSILKHPSRYLSASPEPTASHSRDSVYTSPPGPEVTFSRNQSRHTSQSLSSFNPLGSGDGYFVKSEAQTANSPPINITDDDNDIYANASSRIEVEHRDPLDRRLTHPHSPLPPLPLSAFSVTPHPFGVPHSGFSSSAPMTPHFAPLPQLPATSLPPPSRRETVDFPAGTGNNGYPVSRTLDPTPYGSVAGLDPRSRSARRRSSGPITALSANDHWHEPGEAASRNRSLERRGSTLAVRAGTAMSMGRPITVFREDPDGDPDGTRTATGTGTEVDWIVPVGEKTATVAVRLRPTLRTAKKEKKKASRKARITGYLLNIAIGLQILLGALTTGLSVVIDGLKLLILLVISRT
ncbi:hypothetical protein CPB83DRAFT_152778 [Crepidotus variabilis]|uniref:SMODS and SLOG-associating 2TM effector domain-containing protein n=1 Tax=Crepidotus variabilis TaxID=179855 RepID=A0A9P6EK98_9AGAR|nr:hypothetical protein CPB83DRAFT_152778 [Crepidotus variabilis]